jgi:hypothetical protein
MPRKCRRTKRVTLPESYQRGFLFGLDRRTELARVLKERFATIADDLGGIANLSTIKAGLLERYIWLEAVLQRLEEDIAKSPDPTAAAETISRWVQASNSLMGFARQLGLERVKKRIDLRSYVNGHPPGGHNGNQLPCGLKELPHRGLSQEGEDRASELEDK